MMELTKEELEVVLTALYFRENECGWTDAEEALVKRIEEELAA